MGQDVQIRHIAPTDWDGITALEAAVYTENDLSEGRAALESKAQASPDTCFVLDYDQRTVGYLLALPYPRYQYPDLTRQEQRPFHSDNLHLHDIVIAESFRGRGFATRLLGRLTATARAQRYERISLIAVAGSDTFWSANGYRVHDEVELPASYGKNAMYMSRAV
jgi:ribosomal protein S18 acetylase RimI-like enzyme